MRPGKSCRFRLTARRHSFRGGAACRLLCTPGTWPGGPARSCTPTPAWMIAACSFGRENWRTAELTATPDQTAAVVSALRHAAYARAAASS